MRATIPSGDARLLTTPAPARLAPPSSTMRDSALQSNCASSPCTWGSGGTLSRRPARTSPRHSSRRAGRSDARPGLIAPGRRSCGRARHHLVHLRKRAPDHLFELSFDPMGILETDVAGDLRHDMGVDALVAIAELHVDAAPHLG